MKALAIPGVVAIFAAAAAAGPAGDIVWPEYTLVTKPYDPQMNCSALKAEIDRVTADLDSLHKAKVQAEEAMRVVRDMRSPTGMVLAETSSFRSGGKGVEYAEVRHQVKASTRIAELRLSHLNELLPRCRP